MGSPDGGGRFEQRAAARGWLEAIVDGRIPAPLTITAGGLRVSFTPKRPRHGELQLRSLVQRGPAVTLLSLLVRAAAIAIAIVAIIAIIAIITIPPPHRGLPSDARAGRFVVAASFGTRMGGAAGQQQLSRRQPCSKQPHQRVPGPETSNTTREWRS
ncbi:hypothetical protein P154DRAFT_580852 [Amniculicola lignicola CBS 123094]|uniref:Uncharacterized protein n=1 Tax=Amniculicola lignicola CBS 123094 TaxID=1392246 RepID=A0A6A5W8H4_9PLEO|nr:hypothetical protein P154DRAFT_580852 [Amniculicola lignicola CBS 123094]